MRRPSALVWQETLAQFLTWSGSEMWEGADSTIGARMLQELRRVEYHELLPAQRVLLLKQLCERGSDLGLIRTVVDRRAEWLQVQPWSWDVAAALGRVQGFATCKLIRPQPIGRDECGRLFWLLEGSTWVQSEAGTRCYPGANQARLLLQALERPGGQSSTVQLHFTLSRLLESGVYAGSLQHRESGAECKLEPPLPARQRLSGCAIPCIISGRRKRLPPFELLRHVEVRFSVIATRRCFSACHILACLAWLVHFSVPFTDITPNAQAVFVGSSDHRLSMLDVCRYLLLWIECQLPGEAFEACWVEERPPWVEQVHAATEAGSLAPLLLQLEVSLKQDLFSRRWLRAPFEVCAPSHF